MAFCYSKAPRDIFLVSRKTAPLWLPLPDCHPFVQERFSFLLLLSLPSPPTSFSVCEFLPFLAETADLTGHH